MKKYVFVLGLAGVMMTACTNNKTNRIQDDELIVEQVEIDDTEPKQFMETTSVSEIDSLGYYGVYEGAKMVDGTTLKTKLVLYDDNRYEIEPVDVAGEYVTETEEGTYMVHGDLLTLVPDHDGTTRYYKRGDGNMEEVDENRQVIPTQHATNFRMLKEVD